MSAPTPTPQADDDLAELATLAMGLARLVSETAHRLAAEQPDIAKVAGQLPTLTRAFDRLARSVRQTRALIYKFQSVTNRTEAETAAALAARARARRRIIRAMEDAIAVAPQRDVEYLLADFAERLDDPVLDEELATRPTGELIAELREDLGLPPAYDLPAKPQQRDAVAIALLAARAAAPVRPAPVRPAPEQAVRPVPS